MSNDPKDTVVDLSKLMQGQQPVSTPAPPQAPVMLTTCNEGANLVGIELSTQNGVPSMIGNEHFSEHKKTNDKPE